LLGLDFCKSHKNLGLKGFGGENGIRSQTRFLDSVTYRKEYPADPNNAAIATPHCPQLPAITESCQSIDAVKLNKQDAASIRAVQLMDRLFLVCMIVGV